MHSAVKTNVPTDLVSVGYITGAYGVQGWVRIHPYSADAGALLHAKTWWLIRAETKTETKLETKSGSDLTGQAHDVEALEAKRHGDGVVARIMGIEGRDAAESLKGTVVQIRRSHFPVLTNNEFYWLDLIGLAVENCQGESLGVVVDLIDNGAHPILRVVQTQKEAGLETESETGLETELAQAPVKKNSPVREYLIPFVDHFVPSVDQKNKKIIVDWGMDY